MNLIIDAESSTARLHLAGDRRVPLIDEETLDGIRDAFARAAEARVGAIVVTGGRFGTFAAGADLRRLARLDPLEAHEFASRGQQVLDCVESFPGGVIAAISGECVGGAFDLAMACDLRYADDSARFRHPGPILGFITGYGGTDRLRRLIGPGPATGIMTGIAGMDAEEALRVGLVARVTDGRHLIPEATQTAERIAATSRERLRLIKTVLLSLRRRRSRHAGLLLERALSTGVD